MSGSGRKAACFGSARSSAAWRDDAIAAMPSGRKTRADVPRTTMPPSSGRPPALAGRRVRADAPRGRPSGAADAGRRRAAAAAADAAASRAAAADAAAVDARAPPTLGRRRRAVGDVRSARSARASVWSSASLSSSWHVHRLDDRRRRHAQPAEEGDEAEAPLLEARALARRRLRAEEREAAEPAHEQRVLAHPRVQQRLRLPERARARTLGRRRRQRTRRRRAGEGLVDPHRVPRDRVLIALRLPPRRRARGLTLLLFCVGEPALRQALACEPPRGQELARRVDGRRSRGAEARRRRGDVGGGVPALVAHCAATVSLEQLLL